MIPVITHLYTARSNANQSSYTSSVSVTPSANRLLLLGVYSQAESGTANTPTPSAIALGWTLIGTSGTTRKLSLFHGLSGSSPGPGNLVTDFGGQTQLHRDWTLFEVGDCILTGVNGADAIVQFVVDTTPSGIETTFDITLAAFAGVDNRPAAVFALNDGETLSATGNTTLLGQTTGTGPESTMASAYSAVAGAVTLNLSAVGAGAFWRGIAVEIAGSADVPAPVDVILRRTRRRGLNSRIN
jgi:hypothetical protein